MIMNEEEMRNIIKDKLKKMSKEQLIDTLTAIYMSNTSYKISNAVSSIECTNIADTIDGVQQVNASFDPLKRISEKEVNNEG